MSSYVKVMIYYKCYPIKQLHSNIHNKSCLNGIVEPESIYKINYIHIIFERSHKQREQLQKCIHIQWTSKHTGTSQTYRDFIDIQGLYRHTRTLKTCRNIDITTFRGNKRNKGKEKVIYRGKPQSFFSETNHWAKSYTKKVMTDFDFYIHNIRAHIHTA